MIAIFAAMEPEVTACLGCFGKREDSSIAGYPAVAGDMAVVCRTGIGPRARECVEAALQELDARVVLSVGTAGGLHPERRAGEVVVCERVDHASARGAAADMPPVRSDAGLIEEATRVAKNLGLPARIGSSVTLDTVAWTPQEKADLHGWLQHDVVEMESYWIGRAASERGLPFLAVRVVTDHADDVLPQVTGGTPAISEGGTFDPAAFQAFIRDHPELVPIYAEQVKRSAAGLASLTAFMTGFIPRLAQAVAS